jgi:hypothetical protein
MPRLASLAVPVVVVAQYNRVHWMADSKTKARDFRTVRKVLDCAGKTGLIPFDVSEPLKPRIEALGIDALFRADHHSAKGNRLVADLIRRELVRRHLLDQAPDH